MLSVKFFSKLPSIILLRSLRSAPFDPIMLMVERVLSWCSLDSLTTATPPPSSLELFTISLPSNCQEMAAAGMELILQTRLALEPEKVNQVDNFIFRRINPKSNKSHIFLVTTFYALFDTNRIRKVYTFNLK